MKSSGYPARRSTRQNSSWDRDAGPDVIRQAYARHARARASPHLLILASGNDPAGLPASHADTGLDRADLAADPARGAR